MQSQPEVKLPRNTQYMATKFGSNKFLTMHCWVKGCAMVIQCQPEVRMPKNAYSHQIYSEEPMTKM